VARKTAPESATPGIDRTAIEIIANDAFLVRGWARSVDAYDPNAPEGGFRGRARSLLASLLPEAELDSLAAGEAGLLELDSGHGCNRHWSC
jgi:hypothetical protein